MKFEKVTNANQHSLIVKNCTKSDFTIYTARCTNDAGEIEEYQASLSEVTRNRRNTVGTITSPVSISDGPSPVSIAFALYCRWDQVIRRVKRDTFFENRDNFFFSSYLVNSKAEIGGTGYFSVLVNDSFTDVKWCKG